MTDCVLPSRELDMSLTTYGSSTARKAVTCCTAVRILSHTVPFQGCLCFNI